MASCRRWPTFSGPYNALVGVRSSCWASIFEDCMTAAALAEELSEGLSDVEASVGDLVAASEEMKGGLSYDFGESLMTQDMVDKLAKKGFFGAGKGRAPTGETVPKPKPHEAVVYQDLFACGLRFPLYWFPSYHP